MWPIISCADSQRGNTQKIPTNQNSHTHTTVRIKTNNHLLNRITSHPHCQIRICCRHTELKVQSSSLFMTCRSHFLAQNVAGRRKRPRIAGSGWVPEFTGKRPKAISVWRLMLYQLRRASKTCWSCPSTMRPILGIRKMMARRNRPFSSFMTVQSSGQISLIKEGQSFPRSGSP